jgi:hypothetical protein
MLSGCAAPNDPSFSSPSPAPQPAPITLPPTLQTNVLFGDADSVVALAGVTGVVFDLTGSQGSRLAYDVDFGDGSPHGTSVRATHVYPNVGDYTATATITDAAGRTAASSLHVPVTQLAIVNPRVSVDSPITAPYLSSYLRNPRTAREEIRMLNFSEVKLNSVRGVYRHPEGWWSAFSGTIASDHTLDLALTDGTIRFHGTLTMLGSNRSFVFPQTAVTATVEGGSADAFTLKFQQVDPY